MSDRFEPIFYAKVTRRGQTRAERVDLSDRVLAFSFEDNERKADKLKLTVDNWDLANFDTPIWEKGNQLEISWGYVGAMAPARRMVIKKVTGSTKLSIEAYSKAFLLDTVPRTRCFENKTRSQIAVQIAEENGFAADQQDIEDTEETIPSMSQARMTDAAFMRKLAQREWFEFFIDFDGFHFHKRKLGQAPLRELVWYNSDQGDILSFNVTNDITKRIGGRKVKGRDPIKKKDFEVEVDATEIEETLAPDPEVTKAAASGNDNRTLGPESGPRLKGAAILAGSATSVDSSADLSSWKKIEFGSTTEVTAKTAKRKARGKVRKQRQATVKMKLKIVGDPLLLAKSVVKISGVGKRLSGNYYVKSHKHALGASGFGGELEVLRDGNNRRNVTRGRLFFFSPRATTPAGPGAPPPAPARVTNCAGWLAALNDAVTKASASYRDDRSKNKPTGGAGLALLAKVDTEMLKLRARNAEVQQHPKEFSGNSSWRRLWLAEHSATRNMNKLEQESRGPGFRNTIRLLAAVGQARFRAINQCKKEPTEVFNSLGVSPQQTPQALTPRTVTDSRGTRIVYVNGGGRAVE